MRVAIIDLGTNSVRFDIHSIGKKAKLLHREKIMIRLGQGVFVKGKMDPTAVDRAMLAFERFRRVADGLKVRKIVAFGTSALREAQDGSSFVEEVKERSGIEVKVISGKEEAKLISLGILSNEKKIPGRFALVDIGGGSTEISVGRGKKVTVGDSFPLGTARLQQVFLKKSPPSEQAIRQLREYIRNILSQRMQRWSCETIVGSSGTVKAVTKILNKKSFSIKELSSLVEKLCTLSTTELLDIEGMEAKRVDMILAGVILLEEIAFALKAKKIVPTEFSLRDGIIQEEIRLTKSHKSSLIELHMDDLFSRAARFGTEEKHARHMVTLADELFRRLRPLHGLDQKWKIYLLSTVILRNAGELISYANREKHAYYLVKNSDFPSMQVWEHEFIARLCLLHTGGKLENKDLVGLGKKDKKRDAFVKLLSLVRLIDGLDLGPRTNIHLKKVSIARSVVKLSFTGKTTAGIETLMIPRKKKLFEETFHRQLILERLKKG